MRSIKPILGARGPDFPCEWVEGAVQRLLLTDEQLWCAIAKNTDALSKLIHQQLESGAEAKPQSNARTVDNLQRQYQDYTAELRRRYP
jgi:hypothetical protein